MEAKIIDNLNWIIEDDNSIIIDYYLFKNRKFGNVNKSDIKEIVFDYFTNLLKNFKIKNNIKYKLDDIEFRKKIKKLVFLLKNDLNYDNLIDLMKEFIKDKNNVEPFSLLFLLIIISDIEDGIIVDKKMYLKYIKQFIKLDMKEYSGFSNIFDKLLEIEKERMKSIDVVKFYT